MHGVLACMCAGCNNLLGIELMENAEGPSHVFNLIYSRFK